jgi:DUF4097 and DUF4098 domain-containing protein YvlB
MTRFICAALLTGVLTLANASNGDVSKVNGSIRVTAEDPAGDVSTVNGSIQIEDGGRAEDVETVNGSISIGADTVVGSVETVNGRVSFGERSRAEAVDTVNGSLNLGDKTQVSGPIGTVNGGVQLAPNVSVAGDVTNVNGKISLDQAHVGGGLRTTNGDIEVGAGSRVVGGILVEKPNASWFWRKQRVPQIVIGPGAVVEGTLKFEREVELYVSESAKIGAVEGAKSVMFSGDEPGRTEHRAAEPQVEK